MLRPPVEPMLARAVPAVPAAGDCPGGCVLEPKFDGFRALLFTGRDGAYVQSRAGRPLHGYFPDIVRISAALPPGVVLDGELVVWEGERTSFAQLQRRLSAGARLGDLARRHPAHLVAFDLLQLPDGRELLNRPLTERRAYLVELLAGAPAQLALCPQTADYTLAGQWLADWTAAGVEGLMVKGASGRYQPGRRGWSKYRHRSTTEAVVGGFTGAVDTLLLGRYDEAGRLRYAGRSTPLTEPQRREIAPLLRPAVAAADRPWPEPLPAAWSGQLPRPEPLPYEPVRPAVVAEISVDTAFEWNRWRHAVRYLRVRAELQPSQLPLWTPDGP